MEQLKVILDKLIEQFGVFFPKFLAALALLIGGWILAKILAIVISRVLRTIKIDKLGEKLQEIDLFSKLDKPIRISTILAKTVFYIIMLIFVTAAAEQLGMNMISVQIQSFITYAPKLITAVFMFIGGVILSNFIKNILNTAFRSLGIGSGVAISAAVFYFLLITISITALDQAGLDTHFLTQNLQIILAGLVVAFAIGFGFSSRDILKNVLAGSYARRKFNVGQVIKVGEYKGVITNIDSTGLTILVNIETGHKITIPQYQLFNTIVETFDNEK